ncbi:MAG: radical SAM protein, partial [Spirochaetes bacterium]|nr:radical SAM protein [Spirochaetota bacterium]
QQKNDVIQLLDEIIQRQDESLLKPEFLRAL